MKENNNKNLYVSVNVIQRAELYQPQPLSFLKNEGLHPFLRSKMGSCPGFFEDMTLISAIAQKESSTLVKKGATLGANCTIICGHTIGRYAFIGAGAVVTKDVHDHAHGG